METCEKTHTNPTVLTVVASVLALMLLAVLSLTLQARAEPTADPTVDKQVNISQAAPGETLTYTIFVENTTLDTIDAQITDTLPPEVDYMSDSLVSIGAGAAGYADGVITWTCDSFAWGTKALITFTVQISPDLGSATVVNTAEFTGSGKLITSTVSTVVSPGQLEVLKTVNPSSVRPDEQVAYAIYINNTGYGAVDPFSVTDSLPPEVSYAGSLNADGGTDVSCGEAGDTITCTGRLDYAAGVTITFTADVSSTLSEGTVFTNTVNVAGVGLPVSDSVAASVRTDMEYFLPIVFNNYPPILTLTVLAPVNGVYTASWMYVSPPVEYVLQEATSSNFGCGLQTYTTTEPYKVFDKGSAPQTWYYRVRADGPWGQGPAWSNIASSSNGYYDDFSCSASGWPADQGLVYTDGYGGHYWKRGYTGGQYRIYVDSGGPFMWFIQPDALAPYQPPNKYCVEASVRYEASGWWDNAALIIGANEANTQLYMLGMSFDNSWGLRYKSNYVFPKTNAFSGAQNFAGSSGPDPDLNLNNWSRLQVSVDGNKVTSMYINGKSKLSGSVTMPGLSNMTRVGFLAGVYEITPMDFRVNYFKVTPNVECTP